MAMDDSTVKFALPAKGVDRTRTIIAGALVVIAVLAAAYLIVLVVLHPGAASPVGEAVAFLIVTSFAFQASTTAADAAARVRKLEAQAKQRTWSLVQLVTDAKNAALAAGHDEANADRIAQEILVTAVKRAGAWQPTP